MTDGELLDYLDDIVEAIRKCDNPRDGSRSRRHELKPLGADPFDPGDL